MLSGKHSLHTGRAIDQKCMLNLDGKFLSSLRKKKLLTLNENELEWLWRKNFGINFLKNPTIMFDYYWKQVGHAWSGGCAGLRVCVVCEEVAGKTGSECGSQLQGLLRYAAGKR